MSTAKHAGGPRPMTGTAAIILAGLAALGGCGGGAATTPGSGGASGGGSGGTSGTSGAGSGGSNGSDASTGSGGAGGVVTCPARDHFTLAIHIMLDVSWPATIGTNAGTSQLHVWNLAQLTASGTALTSMTRPCGSTLPELTLKPLVGGGKTMLEVPDKVWDAPAALAFPAAGTISGWNTGSALSMDTTNVLVGLTLTDPDSAWPDSYSMLTAVDSDSDGLPGITGLPRSGAGYVQPPVAAAVLGLGAKADQVYLVSRTAVALTGTTKSCTEQAGTVTVKFFDSHIVGCHVAGGAACTTTEVDFVDTNRTKFTVSGGTFTSKILADNATCTDVRAAMDGQP